MGHFLLLAWPQLTGPGIPAEAKVLWGTMVKDRSTGVPHIGQWPIDFIPPSQEVQIQEAQRRGSQALLLNQACQCTLGPMYGGPEGLTASCVLMKNPITPGSFPLCSEKL